MILITWFWVKMRNIKLAHGLRCWMIWQEESKPWQRSDAPTSLETQMAELQPSFLFIFSFPREYSKLLATTIPPFPPSALKALSPKTKAKSSTGQAPGCFGEITECDPPLPAPGHLLEEGTALCGAPGWWTSLAWFPWGNPALSSAKKMGTT